MRAVVIDRFGGPEVVGVAELPDPRPGPGHVVVRVEAAGVNPVDAATRGGLFPGRPSFPMVLGWDAAGTVAEVGPGVEEFAPGQRVVACTNQFATGVGLASELAVVDADGIAARAGTTTAVEGATLPTTAMTALQALDALEIEGGRSLLVVGAAGQVGGFAVQLAAYRGVEVVAVAAPADADEVLRLGAAQVVDRGPTGAAEARALVRGGVDAALVAGGGADAGTAALAAVRDGGRLASVVPGSAPPAARGVTILEVRVQRDGRQLRELARLMGEGVLTPRVAATLPFDRAAEAYDRVVAGGLRGKLVLVP